MKYKKSMIMLVLLIFIFGAASVCAGDVNDTVIASEDDSAVELSQAGTDEIVSTDENELISQTDNELIHEGNSGTFAELQANITQAAEGSALTLNKNYKCEDGFDSEGICIDKSITIDGNGFIIDAQEKSRIFKIIAENVVLKNIIFTNGKTDNGGAVYFEKSGNVINCNFINNQATYGGAFYFNSGGEVTNCNFNNNSAAYDGGAGYFFDTGTVTNCTFINNSASEDKGGAIWMYFGRVENCSFINNSAAYDGGAVFFNADGEVTNCNFTGNNATMGSAIYFDSASATKTVSNSLFLNNRANAESLEVIKNDNNITITFMGNDNLLNAIYSKDDAEVTFTNVTYWSANGISNTGSSPITPPRSNRGTGQNITVTVVVNGEIVLNDVKVTDENGMIVLDISAGDNYYITARHDTDSYYTEAEKTNSTMKFNVNVTSQKTHNKTVNITAKSNIFSEVMPGKLLFILPNSTEIDANYGGNGTWWAVHTFDKYTEYDISGSYTGLSDVTVNNATINITKADSTIMPIKDVALYYHESIEVTVATEGATRIIAKINDDEVSVINNYTILISGLGIGNYTLTVTTVPDEDHNPVTVTATITVNKASTRITLTDELLNLYANDTVSDFAALTPADAGTLNYTSNNEDVAKIVNGEIIAVGAGIAKITVSFAGNENYTATENRSFYVIVKPMESRISVNKTEFELVIGDEADIIANATPKDLEIDYATDFTNIISVDENGHIIALSNGTALIFVSVGDNYQYDFNCVNVFVTVKKTTELDVNVSADENNVTITVTVDSTAGGFVKFNIIGDPVYVDVNNGKAVYNLVLPAGDYNVEATYVGDDNFKSNSTSESFTVSDHIKQNTTITPTVTVDGNNVSISIDVVPEATGFVKFTISGNDIFAEVNGGKAVINTVLPAGNYTIPVEYLGDNDFNGNATEITFKIADPESPDVNIMIPSDIKAGDNVNVSVEIQNATGNVTAIIDGKETTMPLTDGIASIPLENITSGNHNIVVIFEGDETHTPAHSTFSFNVPEEPIFLPKATKFVNITISDVNVTAILVDESDNAIPNAVITYTVKGVANTTKTDSDGSFTIKGDYGIVISIDYAGDDTYLATNTTIKFDNAAPDRVDTKFNVTNGYNLKVYAVDYKAGERGAMFDVLLTDTNGNRLVNQSVVFAINGWVHNKTTDENGVAHLQINLQDANKYTCAPCYLGNTTYDATFASSMLTVVKKPITITAAAKSYKATTKTKKYTVTLKTIKGSSADGKIYLSPGKKVTINVNGKTYTAKTNAKGQATFKITKLTKKGKFTATIKFAGDNTYNATSKKVKITIK